MSRDIILASASPRRRELLAQIGVDFTVMVSDKEECYKSSKPEEIVEELAFMKAENVASERQVSLENTVIIGADTVVVLNGEILGKPKDEADAYRMLTNLQGRAHEVYTGVAFLIYDTKGKVEVLTRAVRTQVYVHEMSPEEIHSYIATGEPMDKAGAYGIQGRFAAHIERIDGDYYNVVGLPVSYVYQVLHEQCEGM